MKSILEKIKTVISSILSTLADCIVPTLPILIGVGMVKVLLILLGPLVFNILSETSDTYIVLNFASDAGYYFLPVYIALSSADVFKTNKYIATLVGAMLLSPTYVDIVTANRNITVFGLPIALTDYSNQIISSIIAIWIMSYIYAFLDKHVNNNIKPIFVPLITIIVMIPIAFCAIGPLGVFLANKLVSLIMLLCNIGPLGNAIMCAMIPYITITGLGGANLSASLMLASTGCDPILFFSNVIYNTTLGFVTLALYIKNKKADTLAAAITSAVAGISEPALFGAAIKNPMSIVALTVADFCAGLYAGIMGVKSYALASFGIFGIMTTIGPDSSIIHAAIAIVIGCVVGFTICFVTCNKSKQD